MAFSPITTTTSQDSMVRARNEFVDPIFDSATGTVELAAGLRMRCAPAAAGLAAERDQSVVAIDDPVLLRVIERGRLGGSLSYRMTYEFFQTRNLHVYVRIEAQKPLELERLELPQITLEQHSLALHEGDDLARGERFIDLRGEPISLGVVVKKFPWLARWNDVGCFGHHVLAGARVVCSAAPPALALRVPGPVRLEPAETVEAALFLRPHEDAATGVSTEATHQHPDEVRYVPEGEYLHSLLWETEEVWLGTPIVDGCPQRPKDQLIPRPLGLDVLARKRFSWNNEDFSLWQLTGKDRYWESGVKKAYALLATQNSHGGWFEGVEFYNLPPKHHQMYDTYIAGLFLLEAYDLTGSEKFLEAADRAKHFWTSELPPANGHTEEGPNAWWYRWGGYINEFGYTDERRVLNTHAGATEFLALLYERTSDDGAQRGMENGIAAFKWGLERGIQKGNGQFLYCLSQIDPTLERPGDPPYLQLDLVPQIEDVYTVASSYRLLMANRIVRDAEVDAAIRRALDYWWTGYKEGRVYTYRAYAVLAYALAAGELDLAYALALPALLKQPQHFTSMQRGLSSFVAPAGLPGLRVRVEALSQSLIEPIFLRRTNDEFLFALVNIEFPQREVPVTVELPAGVGAKDAMEIDPGTLAQRELQLAQRDGKASLIVPGLAEFGVTVIRLRLKR